MTSQFVNHNKTPAQLGLVAAMQTFSYSDIEFHHTDASALAAISAGAAESPPRVVRALVYSNPLNHATNCLGFHVQPCGTGFTRNIIYDTIAYTAALRVHQQGVDGGSRKKGVNAPEPKSFTASFAGELVVVGNNHLGTMGNNPRGPNVRVFGGAAPKKPMDADYALSILDVPWCEHDCVSEAGGSKGFARQAKFAERLEVWLTLAFAAHSATNVSNVVSDRLMTKIATALEKQAQSGIVSIGKRITGEKQKEYKRAIDTIKRSRNLSKEEVADIDAVPLTINGDTMKHVPVDILVAAAREVLAEDGTMHIIFTPQSSRWGSSGPMLSAKTRVFSRGNNLENIKKTFAEADVDPMRHPHLTPDIRAVMLENDAYFYTPPKMHVVKRNPESGIREVVPMPLTNSSYPTIDKGSVWCVNHTVNLSVVEGRLNIKFGIDRVVLLYPPSVLAPRFRFTGGEGVPVVLPDDDTLFPPAMDNIGTGVGGGFVLNNTISDDAFAAVDLDQITGKRTSPDPEQATSKSEVPPTEVGEPVSKLRRITASEIMEMASVTEKNNPSIVFRIPEVEECE